MRIFRLAAFLLIASCAVLLTSCGDSSSSSKPPIAATPKFTSTPPTSAQEGQALSYTLAATDPTGGTVAFRLASGPDGAAISSSTLTWTPTHSQSRQDNNFDITATTSEGGKSDQTFTLTPHGNVNGTAIDDALTSAGLVPSPEDLSTSTIEAVVPDGKGGADVFTTTGNASGSFTIANVPAGNYWLHTTTSRPTLITQRYVWTAASDIDTGTLTNGRPDGVPVTNPVTITPNVNLSFAPTTTDQYGWVSEGAKVNTILHPLTVTDPFTTTFSHLRNLIDSSKGDTAFLIHYQNDATGTLSTAVESLGPLSISETDGGAVSVTGSMTPLTGTTMQPVIKVTQFDALAGGFARVLSIVSLPYDGSKGMASGPSLTSGLLNSINTDIDFGPINTAPLNSTDSVFTTFADYGVREYAGGGGIGVNYIAGSSSIHIGFPTSDKPITPQIGPIVSPKIDGADLTMDQTGVSLTPTITWSAPTLGTATFYQVNIDPIDANSLNSPNPTTNSFRTTDTQIQVPPGVLQAGTPYVITITSFSEAGVDIPQAPYRLGSDEDAFDSLMGEITTAGTAPMRPNRAKAAHSRVIRVPAGLPTLPTIDR